MGEAPTRPLLRYHGGKWMLAPWIIEHFPPHSIYVEPFGGAASVLLQKPRSHGEVYNDLDHEVVNLFRVMRERSAELTRAVLWTPYAREEFSAAYEATDDPIERARRFVLRAWMGRSGTGATSRNRTGFRNDVTRRGSTPAVDWYRHAPTIRAVAKRLRGVVVENKPALELVSNFDKQDVLVYADPP